MDGYDGDLAVDTILVRGECWNGADDHANQASVNAGADGLDGPGGFVADERRELRLHEVLTTAEHDLGAVETDGLDAKADLTGGWFGSRERSPTSELRHHRSGGNEQSLQSTEFLLASFLLQNNSTLDAGQEKTTPG